MVSSSHEALYQCFEKDTAAMIRHFQRLFHVPFPEPRDIAALNTALTELEPIERRADCVVRVDTDEGAFLLVLESQGKKDHAKRRSWPYYLSYLHEKYGCEPVLIVMTQSRSTARWAAQPIRLGLPGWHSVTVRPLVLGPDNVPVIADEEEAARDVSLAVFSAITHGRGPDATAILAPLAAVLRTVDVNSAAVFATLVEGGLVDPEARKIWKELMMPVNYFFRHEVAEKVRDEGRVEECVQMTLNILRWRGIEVPAAVRARVEACSDLAQLEIWAERAVRVSDPADLFADEQPTRPAPPYGG